ncbi:DUF4159 domain-containing protein [Blastopirellula retiformator]|uniref:Prenyltransferase and squalene oxidase repeat protein n=1 Tax=Blastopirellula retiformator TaxID=2527970 RepID=A0A5C5VMB5_9BACT|nr:DUF4159 domain-containing protein [Blastopirellula retiformator]TWT38899.1 Prenyltransferase and squalene oxidase repeat protein [Blastopirellula retiformator]
MSTNSRDAASLFSISEKLTQFAYAPLAIVAIAATLSINLPSAAAQHVRRGGQAVTPQLVNESISRGINFLRKQQQPDGGWAEYPGQPGGVTSLVMLAMIESGVDPDDPAIVKALGYLEAKIGQPEHTYALSLQIMAYGLADPVGRKAKIVADAQKLSGIQIRGGDRSGMWTYSDPRGGGGGDNSNTQFAILALDEAAHVGAKVDEPTWRVSHDYWEKAQNPNGSWGYLPNSPGRGSMTAAGISSMIITTKRLAEGDAVVNGESIQCCGQQTPNDAIEDGYNWLGRNFTVYTNPADGGDSLNLLYYLYAVERVGRLGGRRFIGDHDWYREGAEMLVNNQDSLSGSWRGTGNAEVSHPAVATSLALLFLAKGRRPVLIAKYKHDADGPRRTVSHDWNRHRSDIANLTHFIEPRWGNQRMTWQVIDAKHATTEDLLQTPVLWISGSDGLKLTAEQEKSLKLYIEQGGFVFAEAACGGAQFDADFRALMKRLFPEAPLRLLPPDHPIWFAEAPVEAEYAKPLLGIDACCRTSVVYCPEDLGCFWELNRSEAVAKYPEKVRARIEAGNLIGANVLAYATGRKLKEKLQEVEIDDSLGVEDGQTRNTLIVGKVRHTGGADDAPAALSNMVKVAGRQLDFRFDASPHLIPASNEKLYEFPILFMHGRRDFKFTPKERTAIYDHLNRGGFLFADAICASVPFTTAFRREMKMMFPDAELKEIPLDHPIFSEAYNGFDITTVSVNDPQERQEGEGLQATQTRQSPKLEGLWIDDRLVAVFSPLDLSCAMENGSSLQCEGYIREDAARIAANILLYAMQQ